MLAFLTNRTTKFREPGLGRTRTHVASQVLSFRGGLRWRFAILLQCRPVSNRDNRGLPNVRAAIDPNCSADRKRGRAIGGNCPALLQSFLLLVALGSQMAMSISLDDQKLQVKQANDIVELVGGYIPQMRRAGSKMVCQCPWHDDRRPSLQVDPGRQTWVCWVCDIRGDVFDFVMRREGVDFPGAMRILADRAGIELKRTGRRAEKGSADDKQALYQAMTWAQQQFQACLHDHAAGKLAREYLAGRGITPESVERFRLGFSPLDYGWLLDRARSTPWSEKILEATGLVVATERGSFYDRFRGRLIFPIHDTLGRTIAFGGRLVPGVFPDGDEPPGKYINSPETRLFSKSDNLYGLNLAVQNAGKSRQLVVVEGYTDVIGAVQAGLDGVVAALGTAVNQKHIRLMKRYADRITLLLDGDAAGQRRTSEVLDLFVAESVDLRILTLPAGLDPFDFVREQGAEQLRELLASAPDALEHRIRIETAGVDLMRDSHRAVQALERILQTIAQAPPSMTASAGTSGLREDQLLSRLSRQFQVERGRLMERLAEFRRAVRPSNPDPAGRNPVVAWKTLDATEVMLLELLLSDATLIDQTLEQLSPEALSPGPLRRLYELVGDACHQSQDVSFEGLMLLTDDPELRDLLVRLDDSAARHSATTWSAAELLAGVLARLREREAASVRARMVGQLENQLMDGSEGLDALQQLLRETRERKGISALTDGRPAYSRAKDGPPDDGLGRPPADGSG